jgi:hypothetical protein
VHEMCHFSELAGRKKNPDPETWNRERFGRKIEKAKFSLTPQ